LNLCRKLNDGGSQFKDKHTSAGPQETKSIRFVTSIDNGAEEHCFAVSGIITF